MNFLLHHKISILHLDPSVTILEESLLCKLQTFHHHLDKVPSLTKIFTRRLPSKSNRAKLSVQLNSQSRTMRTTTKRGMSSTATKMKLWNSTPTNSARGFSKLLQFRSSQREATSWKNKSTRL
jgi:hypothetical protein